MLWFSLLSCLSTRTSLLQDREVATPIPLALSSNGDQNRALLRRRSPLVLQDMLHGDQVPGWPSDWWDSGWPQAPGSSHPIGSCLPDACFVLSLKPAAPDMTHLQEMLRSIKCQTGCLDGKSQARLRLLAALTVSGHIHQKRVQHSLLSLLLMVQCACRR